MVSVIDSVFVVCNLWLYASQLHIHEANSGVVPSMFMSTSRDTRDEILQTQMCCAARCHLIVW
jgi:hypothetical protein